MDITKYIDRNVIEQLTDIDTILQSWECFHKHFNCRPDETEFPKYNPGDAIDEEKSVKWNRKEIKKRNDAWEEEFKRLMTLYDELDCLYEKIAIKTLAKQYGISIEETSILWNVAYGSRHPFGLDDVYNEFCSLVYVYEKLRRAAKDNQNDSMISSKNGKYI